MSSKVKKCLSGFLIVIFISAIIINQKIEASVPSETNSSVDLWYKLGENEKQIYNSAKVRANSIEWENRELVVYTTDVDRIAGYYDLTERVDNSREMAIEHIKEREALYKEAVKMGYVISDEDVLEGIKIQSDLLNGTVEFQQFLKGYGTSESRYWEDHFEVLRKEMAINQYITDQRENFYRENSELDGETLMDMWYKKENSIRTSVKNSYIE